MEALKRVEKEKCRHNSNLNVSKTDKNEVSCPDGLVFYEQHFGISNDVMSPSRLDGCVDMSVDAEKDRRSGPTKPVASIEARRIFQ